MSKLLTDLRHLRRRLDDLSALAREHRLGPEGLEALAECCFRVATRPETPQAEAIQLLRRGFRIDGSNPCFAYHLARLYMISGDLSLAASWLSLATRLSPTSHRIWAHVCLLHRQLNDRYSGMEEYEANGLRERSNVVAQAILAGNDSLVPNLLDFVPPISQQKKEAEARQKAERGEVPHVPESQKPASPASKPTQRRTSASVPRRILHPGCCRWSGIADLEMEDRLEAQASAFELRRIKPLFSQIAANATVRPGGVAAFTISAVEWMICGYPVATVRRLAAGISAVADSPAMRLVDVVCRLMEVEEASLASELAHAVTQADIPPLLAAIIHQRRLLSQPLAPTKLGVYHAAQKILTRYSDNGRPAQVQQVAKTLATRLTSVLTELTAPPPPKLEDLVSESTSAEAPTDTGHRLQAVTTGAGNLKASLEKHWPILQQLVSHKAKQSLNDGQMQQACEIQRLTIGLEDTCKAGLEEIAAIRGGGGLSQAQINLLDSAEKDFQACSQRRGPFVRNLAKLQLPPDPASPPLAAQSVTAVKGQASLKPVKEVLQGSVRPVSPAPPVSGFGALQQAMTTLDHELSQRLRQAYAGFRPYSPAVQTSPPIRALRLSVMSQAAEMFYRMARRRQARYVWSRMLAEEPLHIHLLKNRAVADTRSPSLANTLSSWRAYVEALYTLDMVADDPRPHARARARADFHGAMAASYAPPLLRAPLDNEWMNLAGNERELTEVTAFLTDLGRVREFVDHKMLEYLNAKLDFTSPTLVLGIPRDAAPAARQAACKTLSAFASHVTPLLPSRAVGFARCIARCLDRSAEACTPRRLTRHADPAYDEEHEHQLNLLAEAVRTKFKLVLVLNRNETWRKDLVKHLTSLDFLIELSRLDDLPLAVSPALLTPAAGAVQWSTDDAVSAMRLVREMILQSLLMFLFAESGENDEPLRKTQYHRLVDKWSKLPILKDALPVIDDPQSCYPPSLIASFRDREASPQTVADAITWLQRFHQRFPEIGGAARLLALLLSRQNSNGSDQEVLRILDTVCDKAICPATRVRARLDRAQTLANVGVARANAGNQGEAVGYVKRALDDAQYVLKNSKGEDDVQEAKKLDAHLRDILGKLGR